jgi:hypothetical protein
MLDAVPLTAPDRVMNGPIEPSADMRAMAKAMRHIYLALIMEGFTESESIKIIGLMLAAGQGTAS